MAGYHDLLYILDSKCLTRERMEWVLQKIDDYVYETHSVIDRNEAAYVRMMEICQKEAREEFKREPTQDEIAFIEAKVNQFLISRKLH
jgi:tetrahydromethanopterin S-methyltransferase subunit A